MLNNETKRTLVSLANQCMQAFVSFQFDTAELLFDTLQLNAEHRKVSVVLLHNLNKKHPQYSELRIKLLDQLGRTFYELFATSDAIQLPEE